MTESTGYRRALPLLATCLLAFAIPFPFLFGSVGVILVVVAAGASQGKTLFRNFRKNKMLWAPVALYIWALASGLWSEDKAEAAHILSTKLPLLLLPIAIGGSGLQGRAFRRSVMSALCLGIAVVGIYCMGTAFANYRAGEDIQVFFYHRLVSGLSANAVYMAWYVVAALLFLLLEPIGTQEGRRWREVGLRAVLLAILLPFFLLLAARTLLLLFVAIGLPTALVFSFRKKTAFAQKVLTRSFTGVVVLALIIAFQQPAIQARFKELRQSRPELSFLKHYQGEENSFSNMNVRLFLWRVGIHNITSSPAMLLRGTGVGDAHAAINKSVRALGIPNMEKDHPQRNVFYDINLHNTFLHTTLATGSIGLLLLLWTVGNLFVIGLRQFSRKPFLLLFALLSFFFMMQEAVLETQAGVVFYMFIYSVFVADSYSQKPLKHAGNALNSGLQEPFDGRL